jgi:dihydrofolate reductase
MGSVLVNSTVSLDGFVAGPRHEMDWIFDDGFIPDEPSAVIDDVIRTTGAILAGRHSYDVGQAATRSETSSAFGGRWSGPEFVLTHRPPPDAADQHPTFLSGSIDDAVATALAAAGDRKLLVLGANVVQQCLDHDLVDEMLLLVLPVVLGDGIRLFGPTGGQQIRFELTSADRWGQSAVLRFARRG